ncbi:Histidine ammonia-lyase [bioreactor metagenome]|uniref:Histidine ammonia-lyase n=1 Tax=bioreactor metagenome TaxID=1076179 RepID=A0A644YJY5_9ZZZZ
MLYCHSLGIEPLSTEEEVRAMMLVRLNTALCGSTGISVEILKMLRDFLNKGIHPVVPRRGSIGEGDITILSHIGLAIIGEGEVNYKGKRINSKEALSKEGMKPAILGPKDGLSIVSSNAQTAAGSVFLVKEVEEIIKISNVVYCLGMEGLNGVIQPLDERVNDMRGLKGQIKCADECRKYLEESYLYEPNKDRALQDALSFRCSFAINGSVLDALEYVKKYLLIQINTTDDNPCIMTDINNLSVSANFEITSLVAGIEMLGIVLCHLSKSSCNRMLKLADPSFTKLTRFLTPDEQKTIAYGTIQKTFTAIDAENRMLANPSSIDFYSISGNIEDHATNGPLVVDKVRKIVDNLKYIIGMEAIHAAQAVDLRNNVKMGKGTKAAYDAIRGVIPYLDKDRNLSVDIKAAYDIINSGELLRKVENAK